MTEERKETRASRPVLGILAHVDAGKTTLSEALLYRAGAIRKMGRVDTRDAFLDTDATERARGITIYSKTALFSSPDPGRNRTYTLLDTPGHADFSAETERTLSVLDLAVLLISAPEGVNVQVKRLFSLLGHYRVPTVLFVNKTDQLLRGAAEADGDPAGSPEEKALRGRILSEIGGSLTGSAVDLTAGAADPEVQENLALASGSEELLERLMDGEQVTDPEIRALFAERRIFPVLFGSALRDRGVAELLSLLDRLAPAAEADPDGPFSARVFKIARDKNGERETWMKITGGTLRVRQSVSYCGKNTAGDAAEGMADSLQETDGAAFGNADEPPELSEKVSQIRLYNGERVTAVPEAEPGMICAVTGLSETYAGQGLGGEANDAESLLQPVLAWQIVPLNAGERELPRIFRQLKLLEEEEPMLQIEYDERKKELRAHLMGQVQREVLIGRIHDRFGLEVTFGRPSVVYKETIASAAEGVGHFEPLRHYAEVHLLLSPGDPGSGVVIDSACPTDVLPRQYQNQVLASLSRRIHRGVLTGSALTDVRITLTAGRAHEKHTEGGDFRQAAYRAVRMGLMYAENVLLEPFYDFVMELPQENLGRALLDLQNMGASFSQPEIGGGNLAATDARITGSAPVSEMGTYPETLSAYTKGRGTLQLRVGAYRPCHNAEAVIEAAGYDPEADRGQPSASVFCSHGAGTLVPWYEVRNYMHVGSVLPAEIGADGRDAAGADSGALSASGSRGPAWRAKDGSSHRVGEENEPSFEERSRAAFAAEEELKAIFERTFGPVKRRLPAEEEARRTIRAEKDPERHAAATEAWQRAHKGAKRPAAGPEKEYLLVDGYNIIYAWETLRDLAQRDVKAARDQLLDILSNYSGYVNRSVICVFDAYRVPGGQERIYRYHNIDVVFTREAETADQYIEKAAHELGKQYAVAVATSDAVEQIIIFGAGARRLSANDLLREVVLANEEMRAKMDEKLAGQAGMHRAGPGGSALRTPLSASVEKAWKGEKSDEDT